MARNENSVADLIIIRCLELLSVHVDSALTRTSMSVFQPTGVLTTALMRTIEKRSSLDVELRALAEERQSLFCFDHIEMVLEPGAMFILSASDVGFVSKGQVDPDLDPFEGGLQLHFSDAPVVGTWSTSRTMERMSEIVAVVDGDGVDIDLVLDVSRLAR